MERIRVLLITPMESPRLVKIDHTAEELHQLVGGDIACTYPWEDLVGLVYADDAIALGYPLNRTLFDENGIPYDVVKGTFIIAGLGGRISARSPMTLQPNSPSVSAIRKCSCELRTGM